MLEPSQISVVDPEVEVVFTPSAAGAFVHVTPVWEMLLILLAEVPRVVITAIRVLPIAGDAMLTVKEATAFTPVLPVAALPTRAGVTKPARSP